MFEHRNDQELIDGFFNLTEAEILFPDWIIEHVEKKDPVSAFCMMYCRVLADTERRANTAE
jgi:hypothetical protein